MKLRGRVRADRLPARRPDDLRWRLTARRQARSGTLEDVSTSAAARLGGVDLARGLAVFGMFAAHVGPDPRDGGLIGPLMQLTHGRSSVLFAALAGLSLALITG